MVTLEEVARVAGVAVSTASRALTGKGQVSPQTIAKVQRTAEKLGYRPNSLARGLKTNSSRLVGLVVHNIFNASYQKLAQVVQSRLFQADYQVILCISNDNPDQEAVYLETLLNHRVDGLIIVPTGRNLDLLERMLSSDIAVITAIRRHPAHRFDTVLQADADGAYEGTKHLLAQGHRRVGLIVGSAETTSGQERLSGYCRAMQESGIEIREELVIQGPYSVDVGSMAVESFLSLKEPITAIFCANHEATQGALRVLSERNISIPDQMSLLCYEDSPWFNSQRPGISVMDNNAGSIGELAVDMLLRAMKTGASAPSSPREFRVGAHLVVRQSCAAIAH